MVNTWKNRVYWGQKFIAEIMRDIRGWGWKRGQGITKRYLFCFLLILGLGLLLVIASEISAQPSCSDPDLQVCIPDDPDFPPGSWLCCSDCANAYHFTTGGWTCRECSDPEYHLCPHPDDPDNPDEWVVAGVTTAPFCTANGWKMSSSAFARRLSVNRAKSCAQTRRRSSRSAAGATTVRFWITTPRSENGPVLRQSLRLRPRPHPVFLTPSRCNTMHHTQLRPAARGKFGSAASLTEPR